MITMSDCQGADVKDNILNRIAYDIESVATCHAYCDVTQMLFGLKEL